MWPLRHDTSRRVMGLARLLYTHLCSSRAVAQPARLGVDLHGLERRRWRWRWWQFAAAVHCDSVFVVVVYVVASCRRVRWTLGVYRLLLIVRVVVGVGTRHSRRHHPRRLGVC